MSIRSACYETLVIRQIYTYPAPVLKEVAQDVSDIDGVVAKTIDDMYRSSYGDGCNDNVLRTIHRTAHHRSCR